MKNALIGYTGLVGKHLSLQMNFEDVYHSKNIHHLKHKSYDWIVCAGIMAKKWWANQHPLEDWTQIQSLLSILETVHCQRFILISTIDVFRESYSPHQTENEREEHVYSQEPYGLHRRRVELFVQSHFSNSHILRLPALFGLWIEKNVIYDMLHKQNESMNISLGDLYQYYSLSNLSHDIHLMIERNIPVLHLFSDPISVHDMKEWMQRHQGHDFFCLSKHVYSTESRKRYHIGTIYPEFWKSREQIRHEFQEFLWLWIFWYHFMIAMPVCVTQPLDQSIPIFHRFHLHRFEIAPRHVWGDHWYQASVDDSIIPPHEIVRIHAFLYGKQENLWNDHTHYLFFFQQVKPFLESLPRLEGITMGSPIQRRRSETSDTVIADCMKSYDQILPWIQWEINAPQFQTDLTLDRESVVPLCQLYPSLSIVVDTGSCQMIQEHPIEYYETLFSHVRHFHFSYFDSWMKSSNIFHSNQSLFHHLISQNYRGFITIEIAKPVPTVLDYFRILLGIHI